MCSLGIEPSSLGFQANVSSSFTNYTNIILQVPTPCSASLCYEPLGAHGLSLLTVLEVDNLAH